MPKPITQPIRVYRFQNIEGHGAYSVNGFRLWWRAIVRLELKAHHPQPGPMDDGLRVAFEGPARRRYLFGFSTKRQAMAWFEHAAAREAMAAGGVWPSAWEVRPEPEAIHFGRNQCVFDPEAATLLGWLDPQTLTKQTPLPDPRCLETIRDLPPLKIAPSVPA